MAGLVLLLLPVLFILGIGLLVVYVVLLALHAWLVFRACTEWCSPQTAAVIIALHVAWLGVSYHHGLLYGYYELPSIVEWAGTGKWQSPYTMLDRSYNQSWTVYHCRDSVRREKRAQFMPYGAKVTGPETFTLEMWSDPFKERYRQSFDSEEKALCRLYEILGIVNVSSYDEMYPQYKAEFEDPVTKRLAVSFCIEASETVTY